MGKWRKIAPVCVDMALIELVEQCVHFVAMVQGTPRKSQYKNKDALNLLDDFSKLE